MDTDCVICYGSHHPSECAERSEKHCPECHNLILQLADHTSVCASKAWIYKEYANLYATPLKERFIISTSAPFRYLKNMCWRKPEDDEMYSSNGAFVRFKSERDISLSTTRFAAIQIMIVIKQKQSNNTDTFDAKLLLFTTKKALVLAGNLDQKFDRNTSFEYERDISLIIAVPAEDDPCVKINIFPSKSPAREYCLRFDISKKMFCIPNGLNSVSDDCHDIYQDDDVVQPQLGHHFNTNQQLAHCRDIDNPEIANVTHPINTRQLEKCFECHATIHSAVDHVETCGAKDWFISKPTSVYVKCPVIRCEIHFKSQPKVNFKGDAINVQVGMKFFSSMADVYFKFESSTKVILLTTGFTRIRLPIVVAIKKGSTTIFMEKLVLITSQDRTIVAAHSSRQVDESSVLNQFEHNTPLVFIIPSKQDAKLTVNIHSAGPKVDVHEIEYHDRVGKYVVPDILDIKSTAFVPKPFDAKLPLKKAKCH